MRTVILLTRARVAHTYPGWRGGPAVYSQQILTLAFLGRPMTSADLGGFDNDNRVVAA